MVKTVTQHIRDRLEQQAFPRTLPPIESLRVTEWSPRFEQLMRNRLLMGAFRYGLMEIERHQKWRMLEAMRKRIDQYEATGNLELMVDVANLCLLEFEFPSIDGAAWAPVDDGEHVQMM